LLDQPHRPRERDEDERLFRRRRRRVFIDKWQKAGKHNAL